MASIVQFLEQSVPSNDRLGKLANHPMFVDLQLSLASECLQNSVPYSLIGDEDGNNNNDSASDTSDCGPPLDPAVVAVQEASLQSDFQLASTLGNPKVQELQKFYRSDIADI
jgi:hypothetical protein